MQAGVETGRYAPQLLSPSGQRPGQRPPLRLSPHLHAVTAPPLHPVSRVTLHYKDFPMSLGLRAWACDVALRRNSEQGA